MGYGGYDAGVGMMYQFDHANDKLAKQRLELEALRREHRELRALIHAYNNDPTQALANIQEQIRQGQHNQLLQQQEAQLANLFDRYQSTGDMVRLTSKFGNFSVQPALVKVC